MVLTDDFVKLVPQREQEILVGRHDVATEIELDRRLRRVQSVKHTLGCGRVVCARCLL